MIDLHTHSTCSDGSETPARLVELAAEAGCHALALTDHDGFFGLTAARQAARSAGVRFVPGCEVSCRDGSNPLHLLCYFVDEDSETLGGILREARADRAERNLAIADRLQELGYPVDLAAAGAEAGGNVIGRPHFAAALVRVGAARSIEDAFERILGNGRPGYVARRPLPPGRVIDATSADGGVVSLAHPLFRGADDNFLVGLVDRLASIGLTGLEAYYASYDVRQRAGLADLALTKGLVPTGGSDFHGDYRPGVRVGVGHGDLVVADQLLDDLEDRRP